MWYVPNRQSGGGIKCMPAEPKLESKWMKRHQDTLLPLSGPYSAHTLPPLFCVFVLKVSLWVHFYLLFIVCVLMPCWLVMDNGPRSQHGVCLMCVECSCLCHSTCVEVKGQFLGTGSLLPNLLISGIKFMLSVLTDRYFYPLSRLTSLKTKNFI